MYISPLQISKEIPFIYNPSSFDISIDICFFGSVKIIVLSIMVGYRFFYPKYFSKMITFVLVGSSTYYQFPLFGRKMCRKSESVEVIVEIFSAYDIAFFNTFM